MNIFTFFANHPERMMLVSMLFLIFYAVCFGIFYFKGKQVHQLWPTLVIAGLWICWALWESYCQSIGANIRVDMLLGLPFIFGFTFALIITQIILLLPKIYKNKRNQQNK